MVPGFLKREMSTTGDNKVKIEPPAKSLKYVERVLQRGKEIMAKHGHLVEEELNEDESDSNVASRKESNVGES